MGRHLSVEEKHNAANELMENRDKIEDLREQINALRYRNRKLYYYLYCSKKSKYNGLFTEQGECYQKYGKKARDLSAEERREYLNKKKQESRERLGRN